MAAMHLEGAHLYRIHLEGARLRKAHLEGSSLRRAHLEDTNLFQARLQGTDLFRAHLEGTVLREAHLAGKEATSIKTEAQQAIRTYTVLSPANLRLAFFDQTTRLDHLILGDEAHGFVSLTDVTWGGANLSVVNWTSMTMLGDEATARQRKNSTGELKDVAAQLEEYSIAVRANRQLAAALQTQGINEDAARFGYRAQVLQKTLYQLRIVQPGISFRRRMQLLGAWLFSWLLFLIAGYGYKPGRSFLAYLLVISGFATAYYVLGHTVGPILSPLGAFVFSMTSFHGRGFFPGNNISLDDPLTVLAAFEALVGLIIEMTFIATLTQRFFNR
jgi:Pentapeptide repeats (8 copies)